MDREEVWIKRNACSFCNGSHLHTCSGYDCKEAVGRARGYYLKMAEKESPEKKSPEAERPEAAGSLVTGAVLSGEKV